VAWRTRKQWKRADRLFVVWSIVVVIFFSISQSKLPGYILTALLALGVLMARIFSDALKAPAGESARIVRHGVLTLAFISSTVTIVLAAIIVAPDTVYRFVHLKQQSFEALNLNLPIMAVSFLFLAVVAVVAFQIKATLLAFAAFACVPLLLLSGNYDALSSYAEVNSSRRLAEQMPKPLGDDVEVVCLECLPSGLPFYLKRLVTVISKDGSELTSNYILFSLNNGNEWPERIVPFDKRDPWIATRDHPVYLLARDKNLSELQRIAARYGVHVDALVPGYSGALLPTLSAR
jgi:4-amino-4-deoxy-L-arabinose transferase-like glycosyltransferase